MSTHKYIDRLCALALALTLAVTALFMGGEALGLQPAAGGLGYEERLFDAGRVHTLDIIMDGWEDFLSGCEDKEYTACTLVIDGEACRNVAIRAKGNSSLSTVSSYENDRYSFKVEFDHYDGANTYYGLDKLSLNNLIQDNTLMKDFLCYQLMGAFGVAAPLCSYVSVSVNGELWGLYLAVEGVEDAFLRRNYGTDAGELYKPDSLSSGGDRGGSFDPADLAGSFDPAAFDDGGAPPFEDPPQRPGGGEDGGQRGGGPGGMGGMGGMGSGDVKLQYADGDPDSYPNIFDNAKTAVTDQDKDRLIAALKALGGEEAAGAVDVEQVLRYFVVHGFVCNGDSYTGGMVHNYYLYEEDGRLAMIPWDYNLAFGGFQTGTAEAAVNEPIDDPVTSGELEDRPMIAWIFRSQEYTDLYHQYYAQFIEELFDSGSCQALIDSTFALIAPYAAEDPTMFCTYEEFEQGVEALKTFCALRAESVRGQLAGTVPSTSQGQAEHSASLVDASGLILSAMGSMSGDGGGPGGFQPRQDAAEVFAKDRPEGSRRPGTEEIPREEGGTGLTMLAGSAALLAAGLVLAGTFRRRG